MPGAPSHPSLSWIATTPRLAAMRRPARVASTNSSSLGIAKRARNCHADSSRRIPVGSPGLVALDDAALDLEVAARQARAAELSQAEW